MKKDKKIEPIVLPEGHKKLVTRRDFLSHGLIGGVGYLMVPSLLGSLMGSRSGIADEACGLGQAGGEFLPFLLIDCSGGATLAGNFPYLSNTGGLLNINRAYQSVGIPTDTLSLTYDHGHPLVSARTIGRAGIYDALHNTSYGWLSRNAARRLQFAALCNRSVNDNGDNRLNPIPLIASMGGAQGSFFEKPLGTRSSSASGGRSRNVIDVAAMRPVIVSNMNDVSNAVSMGSFAAKKLSKKQKEAISKGLSRLSNRQLSSIDHSDLATQFKKLVKCGFINNEKFTGAQDEQGSPAYLVNPMNSPMTVDTWSLSASDPNSKMSDNQRKQRAAIVYNVLTQQSGPGVIEISGCDYHNGTEVTDARHGDNKDLEIGEVIARTVELASRLNTPVMIGIISDGSASASSSADMDNRIWRSDSASTAMAVMGYFDPKAPTSSPIRSAGMRRSMLGHGGIDTRTNRVFADNSTYIGADPAKVSYAMFLNYLALSRRTAAQEFAQKVDTREFDAAEIENHLVWNPRDKS